MAIEFKHFDARRYPVLSVREGYGEWSATYDDVFVDLLDRPLLERIQSIRWNSVEAAADLACGTGRIGAWLRERGVRNIDGLDLTPQMLEQARGKGIYRSVRQGDARASGLADAAYELCTFSLADEHVPDLGPIYAEAARILRDGGSFILLGYHPFFLMNGVPTHFNSSDGSPKTVECHVHLFSDHCTAALAHGWRLMEFYENVVDETWMAAKPKWEKFRNWPVSFVAVWQLIGD
jgi:SAM-dependent methyltransferase